MEVVEMHCARDWYASVPGIGSRCNRGFTLMELIVVLAIICVLSAVAVPAFSNYYGDFCLKSTMWEIGGMIKEAKSLSIDDRPYAVCFDTGKGTVSLVSSQGEDGKWNTADDGVVRSFSLAGKGGGLRFGTGGHGPVRKGLADHEDGVNFPHDNSFICKTGLTGNCGTVYIHSTVTGAAMALKLNNETFGYTLHRWNGKEWANM